MPKKNNLKKVMVIGSGPIVIGQAAEFDYAGSQACRALKEEGLEVVLVNSNPATIMTDVNIADRVYIDCDNRQGTPRRFTCDFGRTGGLKFGGKTCRGGRT